MKASPKSIVFFAGAFYLFLVAVLVGATIWTTGGHFIYALDDPYIHLALAENLAHGHYGINPVEYSSPSSSLIWPFLLLPFAGTSFHAYVPLVWNLLFGLAGALLIGWVVSGWPPQTDRTKPMSGWKQAVTVCLLVAVANLASLTVVGMEHVLQVMLAIVCASGIIKTLSDRRMPVWCMAAAAVAPWVRYEDLGVTAAVCVTLVGLRQGRRALAIVTVAVVPLLAFSFFLHSKGLPPLPMSVLVKGGAFSADSGAMTVFKTFRRSIYQDLMDPDRYALIVLTLVFISLAWRERDRLRRYAFAGTASLGALHLLIGRFGWFGRYEVYAVIFLTLLCMYVLSREPEFLFGYFVMGLLLCGLPYIRTTLQTVQACKEIYLMPYQVSRFFRDYYREDYAVNDLGLASFQRRPHAYVLDVYGLASPEAARQKVKTAPWLEGIVAEHHVDLAVLFPIWFSIPKSWVPVAKMCEDAERIVIAERCIVYYSTRPASEPQIRASLQTFQRTLPTGVKLEFQPEPAPAAQVAR